MQGALLGLSKNPACHKELRKPLFGGELITERQTAILIAQGSGKWQSRDAVLEANDTYLPKCRFLLLAPFCWDSGIQVSLLCL